mmetsp:Transcript_11421/g.32772  ORF Transcript_11421/g.32772 Transcript_11421/m.32772 type:complete len:222 (+) Transcript_11421:576-1241(+)
MASVKKLCAIDNDDPSIYGSAGYACACLRVRVCHAINVAVIELVVDTSSSRGCGLCLRLGLPLLHCGEHYARLVHDFGSPYLHPGRRQIAVLVKQPRIDRIPTLLGVVNLQKVVAGLHVPQIFSSLAQILQQFVHPLRPVPVLAQLIVALAVHLLRIQPRQYAVNDELRIRLFRMQFLDDVQHVRHDVSVGAFAVKQVRRPDVDEPNFRIELFHLTSPDQP